MKVTAKMVAERLGLSEAAVSMALNNKRGVSTATRRRVLKEAEKMGYDFSGRGVFGNEKKGNFGFVVYKKSGAVVGDTPFFAELTDGISSACRRMHYDLVIRYLYEDDDLEEGIDSLSEGELQGIILLATEMDEGSFRRFSRIRIPILVLDSYFETGDYNCVIINNVQGAYQAASYLIRTRKAQPGYLKSAYPIGNFEERADGFYKAVRANGMPASRSQVFKLTPSREGAYADMKSLLESGEIPAESYFADNDHIALGAVRALREAGYRIPEDVSVVGFDDLPLCEYIVPPLTSVHVPRYIMGETAVRRLAEIVEKKDAWPIKIEIGTRLVKRKSVSAKRQQGEKKEKFFETL